MHQKSWVSCHKKTMLLSLASSSSPTSKSALGFLIFDTMIDLLRFRSLLLFYYRNSISKKSLESNVWKTINCNNFPLSNFSHTLNWEKGFRDIKKCVWKYALKSLISKINSTFLGMRNFLRFMKKSSSYKIL